MMRRALRIVAIPPLVLTGVMGGAVLGGVLTIGWILVRRDEGLCWLSGDEMP